MIFTSSDLLNECRDALYENFLETRVATLGIRMRLGASRRN